MPIRLAKKGLNQKLGTFGSDDQPDIKKWPGGDGDRVEFDPNEQAQVTIGDLHGNAMKLVWFLVRYGFVEIDKDTYDDLFKLYTAVLNPKTAIDSDAHRESVKKFGEIINDDEKIKWKKNISCTFKTYRR